jgi:Cadherin domain
VDSPRNEGKDFFEINLQSGEIFTKIVFDREKQGAYALEVEARDGAPSARPNSNQQPNSGKHPQTNLKLLVSAHLSHPSEPRRAFPLAKHTINFHNSSRQLATKQGETN